MLRKRRHILTLLFCLLALTASAAPIDVEEAQKIAENFFNNLPQARGRSLAPRLKQLQPAMQARSTADAPYYMFTPADGQGFVIVSGDDELPEVVGYSYDSPADGGTLPPALAAWLESFGHYIKDVRSGHANLPAARAEEDKATIGPLLTTKWNQDMPFNGLLAKDYVTGCVATSMAQIMKHHEWPVQGEGVLEWYGNLSGEHERIDLSTYTYDWSNMLDEYRITWDNDGNPVPDGYNETQAAAVATLMRDCGYAVDMSYSTGGSGAVTAKAVGALFEHFKYSPGMQFRQRNVYSKETWTRMIRAELEAGRPVNYSGTSTGDNVGHSFVCDGIDGNDLLHINWGWGGMFDGFFDMDVMAPEGSGIGGGSGGYIRNQAIITGIRPVTPEEAGQRPVDRLTLSGMTLQLLHYSELSNSIRIKAYEIANNSTRTLPTNPAILWHATTQSEERLQILRKMGNMEVGYFWDQPEMNHSIYDSDFPVPGKYPFTIVNATDEAGTNYEPFDTGDGESGGILTVNADGTMSLQPANPEATPDVHLAALRTEGKVYAGIAFWMAVTLRNEGLNTFTQPLYTVAIPEGTDESGITDYADYIQWDFGLGRGTIDVIYGKTALEVSAGCRGLEAGKYKIHFCREVTLDDGSTVYHLIPEDAPQVIEVVPMPEYPVLVMDERPLDIWEDEYMQESNVWFGATVWVHALSQDYTGKLEIWALKEGADPSEEILVFSPEENFVINIYTSYLEYYYGNTDAFFNMEEGTYTAYLKYEVNGEMQRIEGDYNQDTFRVIPSDKPQLYLAAPLVVNGGEAVPMGSTVEVEAKIAARNAFSGIVTLYSSGEAPYYAAALYSSDAHVSLAAGEVKDVTFRCQAGSPGYGLTAGRYQAEMMFLDDNREYSGNVQPGDYEASLWFSVTEAIGNLFTVVDYPTFNGGFNTYAGQSGTIRLKIYADAAVDATFGIHAYEYNAPNIPVLQVTEQAAHFEAGETRAIELPYVCPEGTANGSYYYEVYARPNSQEAMQILFTNAFDVTDAADVEAPSSAANGCRLAALEGAFRLEGLADRSCVEVFSASGTLLFRQTADDAAMLIPMAKAGRGVYLVRVTAPDGTTTLLKAVLQ